MFGHGAGYTDWWCGPGTFFPGPWGMIVGLIFWGTIIYLLLRVLFGPRLSGKNAVSNNQALDILKERYARGEINKDEFKQMKLNLS